jgi:hypothetical protein
MAGDPFELPDSVALLLILFFGSLATLGLAAYAVTLVARHGIRRSGTPVTLRYLAAFAAAGAVAVYTWGALHLLIDETAADQACKDAVGAAQAADVDRYETSLVPLRFGCHVSGGGTYEAAVPGYVNPTVLGLALLAIILAIFAALDSSGRSASDTSSTGKKIR